MPKVVLTSLVILMVSSSMIVLPSYAYTNGITLPQILPSPTGIKATAVSSNSIKLTWNAVPTATSYNVYRNHLPLPGFSKIGTSTTTSYLDQTANSKSCYILSANGPSGVGYQSANTCLQTATPTTTSTTTPTTTTAPNPACQSVKTILANSGYSVTVIAAVMAAMKCS